METTPEKVKPEALTDAPPAPKKRKAKRSPADDIQYVQSILDSFEPDEPIVVSAKEAFEHTLSFGKHKGKTIKEVMKTQTGRIYLRYVRQKWAGLRENQKAAIDKAFELYDQM